LSPTRKRSKDTAEDGSLQVEKLDLQLVRRNCEVCEWEALLIEPAGASTLCLWCRAPTRATVIIEQVEGLSAEPGKNPYAAALGRRGGLKGGHARAAALTSKQRQDIARKAANTRWGKTKPRKK
jgi:hypothetical protein